MLTSDFSSPHSGSMSLHQGEVERLQALNDAAILDSEVEEAYDNIAQLAALLCGAPISLVSFVDAERQWFKSHIGLDATQTPRSYSFCAHAILDPHDIFIVRDASQDPRFAENPMVTGHPFIRFYAGVPVLSQSGHALGTLCVIDPQPRSDDFVQHDILRLLSRQVAILLQHRLTVCQLQLENRTLTIQSNTDSLTGIGNRRGLDNMLSQELERTSRTNEPLSVMMLDVDLFKNYNDSYGHAAGDQVLATLALILQFSRRSFDYAARYGGEEFVMVLPNTDESAVLSAAERLRVVVSEHDWPHRPITLSIGVATTSAENGRHTLLQRADNAMYRAKARGRNRVEGDAKGCLTTK